MAPAPKSSKVDDGRARAAAHHSAAPVTRSRVHACGRTLRCRSASLACPLTSASLARDPTTRVNAGDAVSDLSDPTLRAMHEEHRAEMQKMFDDAAYRAAQPAGRIRHARLGVDDVVALITGLSKMRKEGTVVENVQMRYDGEQVFLHFGTS